MLLGPGSYHKQDTLIKESFNRVYSEPPDAFAGLKHSATGKALQSYRRPTTSHQKKENKPLVSCYFIKNPLFMLILTSCVVESHKESKKPPKARNLSN